MLENIVAQIKKYEQIRNKKITLAMVGVLFSMLNQMTEQQYLAISSSTLQKTLSLLLQYKSEYTSPDMLLRHCEQVKTLIDRHHRYHAAALREIEVSVQSYLVELQQRLRVKSIKEDSQLDWRNDIQHLLSVREDALRTTHILDTQKELTTTHYLILRKMFKRAELVLGSPGFRYAVMCLGPLSRGDASTTLALQCHVLIEEETPANYAYIEDLFAVLQCELLGVDKEVINLEVYPHIQVAEHLQATGIVTVESGIQAIENNCEQAIDHADAKCLYGDEALLQTYQQSLNQPLSAAEKKIKETLLQTGQLFKSAPWQDISAAKGIDLVRECLMPLCHAIVQLRHYYRATDLPAHPLMLVNAFISRGHWSEEFGNACRSGLSFLYQLELQQTTKQNRDHSKQNQGMGWQRVLMSIIEKMLKPMGLMMLWLGEANAQAELFNLIKKSREKNNHHAAQTLIGMTLDFLRSSRPEELKSFPRQMLIELVKEFNIQAKQWLLGSSVLMNNYRLMVMLVEKISDLQAQDIELLLLQMELKLQAGLYFTRPVQQLSAHSGGRLLTDDFLNIYFGITNLVEVRTWLEDNPAQNKASLKQEQIEQTIDIAMQNIYAMVARYWKQNVPTSTTHWRNYRQSLQELRQQLKAQTTKGLAIEDLHAAAAIGANQREQRMLDQCRLYLGNFNGILCVVKFGSGSKRKDPTPSSDTECAVVYQEDPNSEQQQQQEEYIHDLLWLWQFEMMLLGESDKKHAGVHLDLPPRIELTRDPHKPRKKFAVVTVYGYIEWLQKAFYEDYTRLIPALLYSTDPRGNQLYDYLMQHLRVYPDLPMQKEFINVVNMAFRSACWNQPNFEAFTSVNIKADFIRPLILGITQLIYYYEIKDVPSYHPLRLLQFLIDRGYLAKDYGETLKEALEYLYKLRNDHQQKHGVQSEDRKEMILWVPRFQQIIDEVLKPFQVLLKAMGDGLAKDDLVTLHPWNFPDNRGVRLSVTMAEKKWLQQIKDELVTDQPNHSLPIISIKTAEGFAGFLPENVVRYLLDKDWIDESGQFKLEAKKTSEKEGTHLVHCVKTQNAFFFFKIFPLQFMEEFETGNSGELLAGKRGKYGCTPKVEIALLEVNGIAYPVTISQPIDGEDLEQKFRTQQANNLVLEKRGFAERVVLEMNVNPGDNQPQNDKIVNSFNPYTQQQEARLICFDNEVNGGPSVIQDKDEVKITIVSHAYCANEMLGNFHQGLAYELKQIDPYLLLMELLAHCERKEQQIRKLFTEKQIKAFFKETTASLLQKKIRLKTDVPESSLLVMPLRENVMEERFLGLSRLLTLIKKKEISYLEALCAVDPYVGNFYKKLHAKYPTVERRFNNGPALFYEQATKAGKTSSASSTTEATVSAHQTKMTKLLSLRTGEGKPVEIEKLLKNSSIQEARDRLKRVQQQYRNLNNVMQTILSGNADVIKELEQLNSHDVRERIINQFDFGQIKSNIADKLLKLMTKMRFRRLRIINCDALTDEILEKILKHSPDLEELTLRNCKNVGKNGRNANKDNLFQMLSRNGQMLVSLHLDGLPNLVVREDTDAIPAFERLRELSIKNCVTLNKLHLRADELRLLQLANLNPTLSYQLQVPNLITLDLSTWQNFREENLIALTGNISCENLTTIKYPADFTTDSQQMTLLKKIPLFITLRIYSLSPDNLMKLFEVLDSDEDFKYLNNSMPKETLVALAANKSLKMAKVFTKYLDEEKNAYVTATDFDEDYTRLLGRVLRLNNTISWLVVVGPSRDGELINISSLIPALQINQTLQYLDIMSTNIGDAGAVNFADFIRDNRVLRALCLLGCGIGAMGATALANALSLNTTLEKINLSGNNVGNEGAIALARAFVANNNLSAINVESQLGASEIGHELAQVYAQLLESSSTLTHLNLSGNGLSNEGIAVIAQAMVHNRFLRILQLSNVVRMLERYNTPFLTFAEVLRRNNTLLSLDLSSNSYNSNAIGKDAAEIAFALRTNSTLTHLDMSSNSSLYLALVDFAQALEINKTLIEAKFSHTAMDIEGCKAMARMLVRNSVLTTIALSGGGKRYDRSWTTSEKFGVEGTEMLIESLRQNRSLTSFSYFSDFMDKSNVDENVLRDITEVLAINNRLVSVYYPAKFAGDSFKQCLEKNNDYAAKLRRAIFAKDASEVSYYLTKGISVFALDHSSNRSSNILQLIAISGDLSVLRFLLELLLRENLSIKGMILFSSYEKLTAIDYAKLYHHYKIAAILEKCLASGSNRMDIARIFAEVNIAFDGASPAVIPANQASQLFHASPAPSVVPALSSSSQYASTMYSASPRQATLAASANPMFSSTQQQMIPAFQGVSQNVNLGVTNNSPVIKPPLSGKEKMLAALNQLKTQEDAATQPAPSRNVSVDVANNNSAVNKPPLTAKEKMLAALNNLVVQPERRVDQDDQRGRNDKDVQKVQNAGEMQYIPAARVGENVGGVQFIPAAQEVLDIGGVKFTSAILYDSAAGDMQFFPVVADDLTDVDMKYFSQAREVKDDESVHNFREASDDQGDLKEAYSDKNSSENNEAQYIPYAVQMERDDPFSVAHQKTKVDNKIIKSPAPGISSSASQIRKENNNGGEIKYKFAVPLPAASTVMKPLSPVITPSLLSPPKMAPATSSSQTIISTPIKSAVINSAVINSAPINSGQNDATGGVSGSPKGSWTIVSPRAATTKNQPSLGIAQPVARTASSPSLNSSAAITRSNSEMELSPFDASSSLKSATPPPTVATFPVKPAAATPAAATPPALWSAPSRPKPAAHSLRSGSPTILGSRGSAGKSSPGASVSPEAAQASDSTQAESGVSSPLLPPTTANVSLSTSGSETSLPATPAYNFSKPLPKAPIPKAPLPATPPKGAILSASIFFPAKPAALTPPITPPAASPGVGESSEVLARSSAGLSTGLLAPQPTKP